MLPIYLISALVLTQSAPGAVVWEEAPAPAAQSATARPAPDLPDWARADPFAWERSQCSPLVRGDEPMETCQARVRGDLQAALGDDLPDGLRTSPRLTDCSPQPDGAYALACNAPRPAPAVRPAAEQDCRTRPQRQGGSVAWTQDCRPLTSSEQDGLRIRIGGRD